MKTALLRNWALALVLATAIVGAAIGPSLAHAKLVSSVPAAEAVVATMPVSLSLIFSENIEPAFSRVEITGPDELPVTGASVAPDPANVASLIVSLPAGLPPGHYTIDWTAVAVDGHKTTGSYSFDAAK